MYSLDCTAPSGSPSARANSSAIASPSADLVGRPGYERREGNRQESRRSYLSVCKANGVEPDHELLKMLSWSRFHGWSGQLPLRQPAS
jgi:hypothetical protein